MSCNMAVNINGTGHSGNMGGHGFDVQPDCRCSAPEPLRPDAQVAWERGQAVARAEDLSLSAQPGASYIEANGRALYAPTGVYTSQGSTLVPVRVLAAALGAQVDWEPASGTVTVTGGSGASHVPHPFPDLKNAVLLRGPP